MGYRSEVAYAVKFKDREHRIRFMAVQAFNPHLDLTEINLLDEENIIIFHAEDCKWYDEYDYVKAHKQLLDDAGEQGCSWEFSRIGEDYTDIKYERHEDDEGDYPEKLEVYTSVHIGSMEDTVAYPIGEQL